MSKNKQLNKKELLEEIESLKKENFNLRNQYRHLFNKINVAGLLLKEDFQILDCNNTFLEKFGFTREEIIHRNFTDFIHPQQVIPHHAENDNLADYLQKLFDEVIKTTDRQVTLQLINASGEWRAYRLTVNITQDGSNNNGQQGKVGFFLEIQDTSHVKGEFPENTITQSNHNYPETRDQLNNLFDNAHDLICICNGSGRFVYTNSAWKKKLGYDDETLSKLKFEDLIHQKYQSLTKNYLNDVLSGKPVRRLETVLLATNNTHIFVSGNLSCRFYKGEPFEIRGIFHDITDRLRAEKAQQLCFDIANIVIYSDDLDSFYKKIHSELKKVITADNFIIGLKGNNDNNLYYPYYVDKYPENIKDSSTNTFYYNSLAAYTIRQNRPVFLNEKEIKKLENNGEIDPLFKFPREWMGVPLRTHKGTIGVIAIKSYNQQKTLTSRDLALLDFISGQIAMIIERKRYEAQINQQTRRLNAIFESSSQVIFSLNKNYELTAFNQNFSNLIYEEYGFNVNKNPNLNDLYQKISPDFQTFWKGKIETAFAGHPLAFEVMNQNKNGDEACYSVFINPIFDDAGNVNEISFISHDITERKNYELALRENEEKFRNIFESFQDIYFRCNLNGKITMISPSIKELLGYGPMEVVGKDITNYYLYDKKTKNLLRQLARQRSIRNFEASVVKKDGTLVQCICNVRLINNQDRPPEIEGVARDITELKNTNIALQNAKEVAENSLKVKEAFLANMSHEIRTPMNGMISMIDLLGTTSLNEEQEEYFEVIKKSSETLMNILNDILDLSKIEAGKMELKYSSVNLDKLLEKLAGLYSQQAAGKGIDFSYQIDQNLKENIFIDETRLMQIITNLTSNALKFTDEGGSVKVKVGKLDILPDKERNKEAKRVGPDKKDTLIAVSVEDTGIGISEKDQKKLFKSFSQADSSSKKLFSGTGLGLSIAKQLSQMMNGNIGVVSKPNKGSTFWFTFQAEKADSQTEEYDTTENFFNVFTESSPKILLVDDNLINRQVTGKILEKTGCQVFAMDDGAKAIQAVGEEDFDLIFMDIQMPHMDGLETTKNIRSLKKQKFPPIIAMTAYSMKGDREKFLDQGMDDYISKPIRANDLVQKIKEWLSGQPQEKTDGEEKQPASIINPAVIEELKKYGGMEMVADTLSDFQQEGKKLIKNCFQSKNNHQIENILSNLHTLKGNAGTLGIDKVAKSAADLEHQLKKGDHSNLENGLKLLKINFEKFQDQLSKLTKEV